LFWGDFGVFDPSALATACTRWSWLGILPSKSQSRNNDFLRENVWVGEIVGFFDSSLT
jgi:hypothetical protein